MEIDLPKSSGSLSFSLPPGGSCASFAVRLLFVFSMLFFVSTKSRKM